MHYGVVWYCNVSSSLERICAGGRAMRRVHWRPMTRGLRSPAASPRATPRTRCSSAMSLSASTGSATGGQPLRQDMRRAFPFAGILFEEYNGSVTLSNGTSERLIPAGEGIALPS